MSNKNDSSESFVNRTKWEKEHRSEKKSFLTRKQEEREAQRALRDFKLHQRIEAYENYYNERND